MRIFGVTEVLGKMSVNGVFEMYNMCDSAVTCPFCVQVSEAFIYLKKKISNNFFLVYNITNYKAQQL